MAFPYKHILVVGATAGIGWAMAERFVETGARVTVVGRRKERLDEFVDKHGADKATPVVFDVGKTEQIPKFAEEVTRTSPDIDCVFLNAGVQLPLDLTDPDKFDLAAFDNQINVNFSSYVALTHAFLPFLSRKETPTSLIFTTSNLSIIPSEWAPAYAASKAALNSFVLCLREQLRNSTVKVIELSPPAVQTELHDHMGKEVGRKVGMPLAQFIEEAYDGFAAGKDQVVVGAIGDPELFREIVDKRRAVFTDFSETMRRMFGQK